MIRQITRETDRDKRLTAAKKLEEFVNQPANIQVSLLDFTGIFPLLYQPFNFLVMINLPLYCKLNFSQAVIKVIDEIMAFTEVIFHERYLEFLFMLLLGL